MYNEKVFFQRTECLVKTVKKSFLKKLSVRLALIKVAIWEIKYQKGQCIYNCFFFLFSFFFFSLILAYNNLLWGQRIWGLRPISYQVQGPCRGGRNVRGRTKGTQTTRIYCWGRPYPRQTKIKEGESATSSEAVPSSIPKEVPSPMG